jgi:hypothetical protein
VPPLLKICDFGFSKGKNESNPKSMVGDGAAVKVSAQKE